MRIKKVFMTIICLYSVFMLAFVVYKPIMSTGADKSSPVLDISTSPSSYLFDLKNLKPGDWAERKLTVKNDGNVDFSYTTLASFKDGSKKLYEQLLINVEDKNGTVLFKGKLSEFDQLIEKKLAHHDRDELVVTVSFPPESGNEFQGLETAFDLVFTARGNGNTEEPPTDTEDDENSNPPGDNQTDDDQDESSDSTEGGSLPQTGESNPIWYYLSGMMIAGVGVGVLSKRFNGDRPRFKVKR
ncbi:TasA family protein [Pseudalkalibacillus decolorationis]|uniref:TasA family protein n=1 Tax=Pseudalkalibacillus decolorationis TaxID=163879 RepID=UPI002147D5C4|nr:TasA family protein [Pseudalkalibacillus decolorationis]